MSKTLSWSSIQKILFAVVQGISTFIIFIGIVEICKTQKELTVVRNDNCASLYENIFSFTVHSKIFLYHKIILFLFLYFGVVYIAVWI